MSKNQLYQPISLYQTRILCLHGDNEVVGSRMRCDLYPADILHPSFGGIGVRSDKNGEDHVVPYEALSYAWGETVRNKNIICNDTPFAITENLHEALEVLRPTDSSGRRYIWIDALCINQLDLTERSRQVRNMLIIYQNAVKVIAWLGQAHPNTTDVLNVLASSSQSWLDEPQDFMKGLEDLYSRSWFRRMWVQQEIHAAKQLVLYCGDLQFSWSPELSNPESLLPPIKTQIEESPVWDKRKGKEKTKLEVVGVHDPLSHLRRNMGSLRSLNLPHLRCFEHFSGIRSASTDFVETLMMTGSLQASDRKDYIYGILGLTDLPARPMSLKTWAAARPTDLHIPIDYAADLADILTTVTWLAVMKCGISIIAKYKSAFQRKDLESDSHLPSWVIDWQLAARSFIHVGHPKRYPKYTNLNMIDSTHFPLNVENSWDTWRISYLKERLTLFRQLRVAGQAPKKHQQLMEDNLTATTSFRKLVVRGLKATQYYAYNDYVLVKGKLGKDKKCWHVASGTRVTDIVVLLISCENFGLSKMTWDSFYQEHEVSPIYERVWQGSGNRNKQTPYAGQVGGLWLLRPVNKDEYTFVAFLSWIKTNTMPLYDHWQWQSFSTEHHRLAVDPEREGLQFQPGVKGGAVVDLYKFVIV